MKRILLATTIAAVGMLTPAQAKPYCAALISPDSLPKKYAKRGPFHSDQASGWIIGQDQLKPKFDVTDETRLLWGEIRDAFAGYGVTLSVLAAPPRPLFVPAQDLAAMGLNPDQIHRDLATPFAAYIAGLNDLGLKAPDLSQLADDPAFYFKRDTHWTPQGAARAATLLAQTLTGQKEAALMSDIRFDEAYEEKGSLSAVVEKSCGARPAKERVIAATYTQAGQASDLLSDAPAATIALVGTSFSDRYQRDAYQVADALSHALGEGVDNYSLTGGGLVGAMLSFVESGGLSNGQYTHVIWESPYTAPLTDVHGLRQVLGALHRASDPKAKPMGKAAVSDKWTTLKKGFDARQHGALLVNLPGQTTGKMVVELISDNGTKQRVKLIKSDRIPADRRSDHWTVALAGLGDPNIARIKLRLVGEKTAKNAQVSLMP